MDDAAKIFAEIRDLYPVDPDRPIRGFGSDALTKGRRIAAAVTKGKLMLKLTQPRVDALVADGTGEPFVMRGKAMREWVLVGPAQAERWPELIDEAYKLAPPA